MWEGGICVLPNTRCSCREWSLGDVNITEERELVEQRRDDLMEYCSVVARWNAHVASVASATPGAASGTNEGAEAGEDGPDFMTYCRYLLSIYDQIEAARGAS